MYDLEEKQTISDRFGIPCMVIGFVTIALAVILNTVLAAINQQVTMYLIAVGFIIYIPGRVMMFQNKQRYQRRQREQ